MDYDGLARHIQGHFRDGLVLVVGSGLSAAEGIPGMPELAAHLGKSAVQLSGDCALEWAAVGAELEAGQGLELALHRHPPSELLQTWIVTQTVEFLLPAERGVIAEVVKGRRQLRLTAFLKHVLKPTSGLPILTTNYDRLIEVACEAAGFHVDTTAIGLYAGSFDHERSCMASCRGHHQVGRRTVVLDHYPRAAILKPHGSLDWFRIGGDPIRCSVDIDADRLIITPGLNKYKAGYSAPFDKHRDLANDHIKRASRLLVVGYGFNDDHLQGHLIKRIRDGTPTLVLTRTRNATIESLAVESPNCVSLSRPLNSTGFAALSKDTDFQHPAPELWDLGVLSKEVLE